MLIINPPWRQPPKEKSFTEFMSQVDREAVAKAKIYNRDQRIEYELKNKEEFRTYFPTQYDITTALQDKVKTIEVDPQTSTSILAVVIQILPLLLMIGLILFFMQQMQGGGNRVMSFGKSRARQISKDMPKVTFDDVAGVDEAVEELMEIKEFLENPAKFQALGAKIPKGVLLYGPPGSGKTLLARAVAGEAGVPFFSISGSDFVEMFVGVGAARVRDLFEQAKTNAPCIIFMDEIDAVGRHRGAGLGGGHDEREQTLNQLLVEMDGFDIKAGVILIAATNRPDILDPALLRPGRFDRQIVVDRPDLEGRRAILKVHTKGKPLAPGIDIDVLARRTPGFTGADLANMVNEAALLSARHGKKQIDMIELEEAIDRVVAGPEKKTRLISDREKEVIAYHETGHAIVAHTLPNADPVHKISIIPRGRALGYTLTLPVEDKYLITRSELVDELAMLLGGRVSEEMVFNDITTGDQNDIERATKVARQMVMEYGMSEKLGPMTLGHKQEQVFLGRDIVAEPNYSDEVAYQIDTEVRRLIDEAHEEAGRILADQRDRLEVIAKILVEKETVDKEELLYLLEGDPAEVYERFLSEKDREETSLTPGPFAEDEGRRVRSRRAPKPTATPKPEALTD
ncbi:MAG: ATP-dependent zinc metalloprotease FtsH [Actinobacteria bacterium]|nr:ATP-dependent zinc metalloprotease FtsH [Actinomycetota bacterium]MBU1942311.1 ATP-dependent zinc metalloprotease FtsH [Actinomycetota bacterium]MBU2686392.1 ATP-dependent zinc metalloprotease FtsH [Actinomycetota bacterium]